MTILYSLSVNSRNRSRLWLIMLLLTCSNGVNAEISIITEIQGLSAELEQNVRLLLSIEQQKGHALLNDKRLRRLHQKAPDEIKLALQPFGFYRPRITTSLQRDDNAGWRARYVIDPGPVLRIEQLKLTVNPGLRDDEVFADYLDRLPLKPGDPLDHAVYESIKSELLRLALERGYFDAGFTKSRVEVDLTAYRANILIDFNAGPRFNFGAINITQSVLEPELLQGFINFETGQPYHFQQLIRLRQALTDSDYFQTVEVSPGEPDINNQQVPITIDLTPRKPNRYILGLGYGTDTGVRGSLGWVKPLINEAGHSMRTDLKVSEIENSLYLQYSIPVFDPRNDRLIFSIGLVDEETDTSESELQTVGVSLNRSRGHWRETLSLDYQREDFEVADTRDQTSLLLPGASWSRTWGDNQIFTLDGIRLDLDAQGAHEDLLSDVGFVQLQGSIKFIQKLSSSNRLIARGRLGSTWTEEFDELPSSVRFFAGGAQSVRGYAYESLGPEDENGEVEGGKYLMVGSVEFDHALGNDWSVALFYDAGNAINDTDDELEHGVGFGLRWQSPVGPVRFDFASAISRDDEPWRVHVNIGPDL